MKIQLKPQKMKPQKNLEDWHPWFAWHPVVTENRLWVWLQTVERRVDLGASEHDWSQTYYRLPQDPCGVRV